MWIVWLRDGLGSAACAAIVPVGDIVVIGPGPETRKSLIHVACLHVLSLSNLLHKLPVKETDVLDHLLT